MAQPQIWHHGLVAREWAEFQTDGGAAAAYFKQVIDRSGQPVLDLGCGTGRLLLPLLRKGIEIEGCDYSRDMLAFCSQRASSEGLPAVLYEQAMHELDLPRRYRTIFACGVIGVGGERRLTMKAMQRCCEHLRTGGTFVFDYHPRWNDPPAWLSRLPENRHSPPQDWPFKSERRTLSDGCDLEVAARTVDMDPLEDVATRQLRLRLWRSDELLAEEIQTQRVEDYSKNELLLMLENAGFSDISLQGDYLDQPATADHYALVFVAKK